MAPEKQLGLAASMAVSRAGAGAVAALSCQKSCGRAPARNNMCAWCYRDHLNAIDKAAEPEVARIRTMLARLGAEVAAAAPKPTATNRCAACRKKVGLLGFACRCARTFCSLHRHAESHACGFDYKTAGRERIAASNPVVVAPKIAKI